MTGDPVACGGTDPSWYLDIVFLLEKILQPHQPDIQPGTPPRKMGSFVFTWWHEPPADSACAGDPGFLDDAMLTG